MFRELHAPVSQHVRALLGDAGKDLDVVPRDDGALWFILGDRQVRMTLEIAAVSGVTLYVHEDGSDQASREIPVVLSADATIIAQAIALELTR